MNHLKSYESLFIDRYRKEIMPFINSEDDITFSNAIYGKDDISKKFKGDLNACMYDLIDNFDVNFSEYGIIPNYDFSWVYSVRLDNLDQIDKFKIELLNCVNRLTQLDVSIE